MFGFLDSRYGLGCHYHLSNIGIVNKQDDDSKFLEESKFGTKWGMFGALESSYHGEKYPRNLNECGNFDEKCLGFQVTSRTAHVRDIANSKDGFSNEDRRNKSCIVKRQQIHRPKSELVDDFTKTCKSERRKRSKSSEQFSLCRLTDAESLAHLKPSCSAEVSLSKLAISEILGPVCTLNSEMNMKYAQRKAKAYVNQIFIDRRSIEKPGMRSEYKPFSYALESLSTNKDLFKTDTMEDAGLNKPFLENDTHKCKLVRTNPEKIVILKPAAIISPENVTCHCSLMQTYQKFDSRVHNSKPTSLSFKEMKRKLKNTFGGNREEPNQIFQGGHRSHIAANSRSILKAGECISRGVEIKDTINSCTNVVIKEKVSNKPTLESFDMPDIVCMIEETMRKKIDLPSINLSKNVVFEAKRYFSVPRRTLAQVLSSEEKDFKPTIRREERLEYSGKEPVKSSHSKNSMNPSEIHFLMSNGSQKNCSSSPDKVSTFSGDIVDIREMRRSSYIEGQTHSAVIPAMDYVNYNGKSKIQEVDTILQREACKSAVQVKTTSPVQRMNDRDDESLIHYVDSHSENETLSSTLDDIPSTPSTIYQSDCCKYREHQSPVSVLEPYFTDDSNSPPSRKLQTARRSLQPLRLDFEECSFNSSPHSSDVTTNELCQISLYVHSVLQSSRLNWNHLSETRPLLHASLFNSVEPPRICPHLDPKLLFDHMNEVLEDIHQCHFCPSTFIKPKITSGKLEEIVVDEIMKEADFYLLPQTEKTTLNQTISKDMANSISWLDIRIQKEEIVIQVSEDVLEETVLDILVETFIDFLKNL